MLSTLKIMKYLSPPVSTLGTYLFFSFLAGLALIFVADSAFALNVEKIGKGVVGSNREKMKLLSNISLYTGLFFVVLGAIVTAFQKKKFALQKRSDTSNAMGPFLIGLGVVFMLLSLAF